MIQSTPFQQCASLLPPFTFTCTRYYTCCLVLRNLYKFDSQGDFEYRSEGPNDTTLWMLCVHCVLLQVSAAFYGHHKLVFQAHEQKVCFLGKDLSFTSSEYGILVTWFVCFWRDSPQWARASSLSRVLDHTQRRTTVGRTPLDEWSACRRDLRLTTHTQYTLQKNVHDPGGIRTHNLRR